MVLHLGHSHPCNGGGEQGDEGDASRAHPVSGHPVSSQARLVFGHIFMGAPYLDRWPNETSRRGQEAACGFPPSTGSDPLGRWRRVDLGRPFQSTPARPSAARLGGTSSPHLPVFAIARPDPDTIAAQAPKTANKRVESNAPHRFRVQSFLLVAWFLVFLRFKVDRRGVPHAGRSPQKIPTAGAPCRRYRNTCRRGRRLRSCGLLSDRPTLRPASSPLTSRMPPCRGRVLSFGGSRQPGHLHRPRISRSPRPLMRLFLICYSFVRGGSASAFIERIAHPSASP